MTGLVEVTQRHDKIFVVSYSRTTAGFHQMNGSHLQLNADVADDKLGAAIAEALTAGSTHRPEPATAHPSPELADLLRLVGVRSYGQYVKNSSRVTIAPHREDADLLRITPMRNRGPREGFEPMQEHTTELRINNMAQRDRQIGEVTREALRRSSAGATEQ
jgi:hypothetical protein